MKILLMALVVAGMVGTVIPTHGQSAPLIYLENTEADGKGEGEGVVMKNEKNTQVTKDRAKAKARGKQADESML
jgi:hypothetical protein